MAQYTKHNSNYIKTHRHQSLKDGSTIFERDWVTVGSQLHFGSGKRAYYNNGNFIFTTSTLPTYQKRHKNGVTVGTWTYDDVKDVSSVVNQINVDEYTEDIRSFVYYGSCVELVRASVENIINTFPGNMTSSGEELEIKTDECNTNNVLEGYYVLKNPFQIDIKTKNVGLTKYDNELRYLTRSYANYTFNGNEINKYDVVTRKMYEKLAPVCYETVKELVATVTFNGINNKIIKLSDNGDVMTKPISLSEGNYYTIIDGVKNSDWTEKYKTDDTPDFSIKEGGKAVKVICDNGTLVWLVFDDDSRLVIMGGTEKDTITIEFYKEKKIPHRYKYYQMFSDVEYNDTFKADGWVESDCIMATWLPDTKFYNACDEYQSCILLSETSGLGYNQPTYTVMINGTDTIEGYIYNKEVVPLIKRNDFVVQPKDEIIEEYFESLSGFEKKLLNRDSIPLYSNKFVTPIKYNLGYVYYKRTYTWPSDGYCIDIDSTLYIDFLNKLTDMAQLYDELWTDNIWRRMTHEAIKNYDWTYTREYVEGDEEDNVEGGERMHKVLNIIGRAFDDIKRIIDIVKRGNRITYDSDRNMPSALISDKLELLGWDVYSTIPNFKLTDGTTCSDVILDNILFNTYVNKQDDSVFDNKWYESKNYENISFADIDVNFMRKLLLSSKRILSTKGTRQSISMIMGMFGYGERDYSKEEDNGDYEIAEEYYTVTPRLYNEKYTDADGEVTTFGDEIVSLNTRKGNDFLYNDDVSGIPVGSFHIYNNMGKTLEETTYLIPYYDQNRVYDGDMYFQSKGGWFYDLDKQTSDDINKYGWNETLSYLHVVPNVSSLMSVNPTSVEIGDIYYVSNINDYVNYTEASDIKSRFFVLLDDYNPERFSSWENLDLEATSYEGAISEKEYLQYVEKAKYLEGIIPDNIGNNPHVGYGKYDNGNEYIDYMKLPFKFSIDTNNIDSHYIEDAENITFDITTNKTSGKLNDKIKIFAKKTDATKVELYQEGDYPQYYQRTYDYIGYDMDSTIEMMKNTYYLNNKVFYLKNKINNNLYRQYFKEVIMKYIMQVIPSTAIIVLEGFDVTEG